MDNSYDFYYSEGLYRTTVCCSCVGEKQGMLQPSPQAFSARSILDSTVSCDVTERTSPGQRGKRERWECYRLTMFLQTVTSLRVVSLVFRTHDLLKSQMLIPSKKTRIFTMEKLVPANISFYGSFILQSER